MHLLALGHLAADLRLDGGGVRDGLLAEHAHEVADLDLGRRRLQQPLPHQLLLLLLPLHAPLRAQLLALLRPQSQCFSDTLPLTACMSKPLVGS